MQALDEERLQQIGASYIWLTADTADCQISAMMHAKLVQVCSQVETREINRVVCEFRRILADRKCACGELPVLLLSAVRQVTCPLRLDEDNGFQL
jgi:hypothetical protein